MNSNSTKSRKKTKNLNNYFNLFPLRGHFKISRSNFCFELILFLRNHRFLTRSNLRLRPNIDFKSNVIAEVKFKFWGQIFVLRSNFVFRANTYFEVKFLYWGQIFILRSNFYIEVKFFFGKYIFWGRIWVLRSNFYIKVEFFFWGKYRFWGRIWVLRSNFIIEVIFLFWGQIFIFGSNKYYIGETKILI